MPVLEHEIGDGLDNTFLPSDLLHQSPLISVGGLRRARPRRGPENTDEQPNGPSNHADTGTNWVNQLCGSDTAGANSSWQ